MKNIDEQAVQNLLQDEEFLSTLHENGVDVSEVTEEKLKELLAEYPEQELSEDELGDVAGGVRLLRPTPLHPLPKHPLPKRTLPDHRLPTPVPMLPTPVVKWLVDKIVRIMG